MLDLGDLRDRLVTDGGLDWMLGQKIEACRTEGSLRNAARMYALTSVKCVLAGLDSYAIGLAEKAIAFVNEANLAREIPENNYFRGATEAWGHHVSSVAQWIASAQDGLESVQRSVAELVQYFQNNEGALCKSLDSFLPLCYDAGEWVRGQHLFEKCKSRRDASNPPTAMTDASISYSLCRASIETESSKTEAVVAARAYLKMRAQRWLSAGQYIDLAQWSKMLIWKMSSGRLTPRESLLQAVGM